MATKDAPGPQRWMSAGRLPPLDSPRAFKAVARHRSFTKAAEELHVTQSALSQRIRALELEFGVDLFWRAARGLEPTDKRCAQATAVRRGLADAVAGLGVALARMSLVGDDLASGRLVAPFPPPVPTNFSFWLVTLPERAELPHIAAFRAWLLEEARSGERGAGP